MLKIWLRIGWIWSRTKLHVSFFPVSFSFEMVERFNETLAIDSLAYFNQKFGFFISNVKGFDAGIKGPLIQVRQPFSQPPMLFLENSDFSFYLNGSLVDEDMCRADIFEKLNPEMFNNLQQFEVQIAASSSLKRPVCPYVFKNARIYNFHVLKSAYSKVFPFNSINRVTLSVMTLTV